MSFNSSYVRVGMKKPLMLEGSIINIEGGAAVQFGGEC